MIKIDFLIEEKGVDGQGVQSASEEDLNLLKTMGQNELYITANKGYKNADIIHVCDVHPKFYFKLKKKKTTVVLVHFLPTTLDGSIKLNKLFFKIFKKYVLRFYKKGKELVTVNPDYVDRLIELGFDKNRITYIPNYVSKENFYPLSIEEKEVIRERLNIPKDKFVVLSCGQTQPRKGIYDFIELAKSLPEVQFLWAGGFTFGRITDDYKKIKEIIDNPPSNVRFLGMVKRNELNQIYNISNVFLSQSYDELFPMTILESSCVNLPIVVRDLKLYDSILFDKVLKCNNNEEFKNTLIQIKNNDSIKSDMINKSMELSNMYSKEKVYQIWLDFYKSLMNKYNKKGIKDDEQ